MRAGHECLDWTLIWNRGHLQRVLARYVEHYNAARPHRSIGPDVPVSAPVGTVTPLPAGGHIHALHSTTAPQLVAGQPRGGSRLPSQLPGLRVRDAQAGNRLNGSGLLRWHPSRCEGELTGGVLVVLVSDAAAGLAAPSTLGGLAATRRYGNAGESYPGRDPRVWSTGAACASSPSGKPAAHSTSAGFDRR